MTMPTVSAPTSREIRATTGAAPVPVPPPAPAVMNTMSAPLSRPFSSSYDSIADWRPSVGIGPGAETAGGVAADVHARGRADDCSSDCTSVLTAMNSTPSTCASIMRLTAFTPAPPTPTTRSTGSWVSGDDGWWIGSASIRRGAGARSGARAAP